MSTQNLRNIYNRMQRDQLIQRLIDSDKTYLSLIEEIQELKTSKKVLIFDIIILMVFAFLLIFNLYY